LDRTTGFVPVEEASGEPVNVARLICQAPAEGQSR